MKTTELNLLGEEKVTFQQIRINITKRNIKNVFCNNNHRSLSYTLSQKPYKKVKAFLGNKYFDKEALPLGKFISNLANDGNEDYRFFLNKYGHHSFCEFTIAEYLNKKGLYCFIVDNQVKYVGRCTDTFNKRINYGYGKIHPKNCFIDGQATNCHINHLINFCVGQVSIGIYDMTNKSDEAIKLLERLIIENNRLEWNIQLQNKHLGDFPPPGLRLAQRILGPKCVKLSA